MMDNGSFSYYFIGEALFCYICRKNFMSNRRGFASDNNSGVHPSIIEAIIKVNNGHAVGYGHDIYTRQAIEVMQGEFGKATEIYFVYNGTGANVIALQSMLKTYEAIICASTAHVNVDECGAPERHTGCKLIDIPVSDGKLTPELIEPLLLGRGNEHHVQPRVISISQSTEVGTVYQIDELRELINFAHDNGLLVHMDGARLSNAAVTLNCSLAETSTNLGIDILSFGGTKNGLMFGEAIVVVNPALNEGMKFLRKQATQLHSKMRYISVQFATLISKKIWYDNALNANKMAIILAEEVMKVSGVAVTRKVESNAVFATIPDGWIPKLLETTHFHVWDIINNEVRWMTSFDTTVEDINFFTGLLKSLSNNS